jgi:hypothetical protein
MRRAAIVHCAPRSRTGIRADRRLAWRERLGHMVAMKRAQQQPGAVDGMAASRVPYHFPANICEGLDAGTVHHGAPEFSEPSAASASIVGLPTGLPVEVHRLADRRPAEFSKVVRFNRQASLAACVVVHLGAERASRKLAVIKEFVESKNPSYTSDAPASEAAVTPPLRMRDDLNVALNAAVKVARTEILGRLVDLGNSALAPDERLRRARRLVRSYQRRRAENVNFPASAEVRAAFSIINKDNYERRKAKAGKTKHAM